jgi:uncharacterized protein YcbK (DUF882 family)
MISRNELCKRVKWEDIPADHQNNLIKLLEKINVIRKAYGKPWIITSGYRSLEDHLRIYKEKGITDKSKIPMKSKHLFGKACDVFDPNLELTKWLKDNPSYLEDNGLWCEEGNKNWVHFQDEPPKSGKRWFLP